MCDDRFNETAACGFVGGNYSGCHDLTEFAISKSEGGTVAHFGMANERFVNASRIEVDAARNDAFGRAPGQVEVAVVVDVATILNGVPLARAVECCRLFAN